MLCVGLSGHHESETIFDRLERKSFYTARNVVHNDTANDRFLAHKLQ